MKSGLGLVGEDRPFVSRVHGSLGHRVGDVWDVCPFLGDVLFLNTVLKVFISKLLL